MLEAGSLDEGLSLAKSRPVLSSWLANSCLSAVLSHSLSMGIYVELGQGQGEEELGLWGLFL